MNYIFKKKQLRLIREFFNSNSGNAASKKPGLAVTNDGKKTTSNLQSKINSTKSINPNLPLDVITTDFTTKKPNTQNAANSVLEIPNTPDAAAQVKKTIETSAPNAMPSRIRITNNPSNESKGNKKTIKEITTFKKNELDKFLKSL